MTGDEWVGIILGLLLIALDVYAVFRLHREGASPPGQTLLQVLLIFSIPLLGAVAVLLLLAKPRKKQEREAFPPAPEINRNIFPGGF
jgi:hypothetical protein